MSQQFDPFLDTPIYGARDIAVAAGVVSETGEPDLRRAYHMLERGYLPASKVGRVFTSTRRRLLKIASGN
jgi:hypothetical protein